MHDPMAVVFDIPAPWFQVWKLPNGEHWRRYHPPLITVWHVEPTGADSGRICKGMGSSSLTWHNVRWAWTHRRHLRIVVPPARRVVRWLRDRCAGCGRRFFWRDSRHSYGGSGAVWHEPCMTLRTVRSQLDDARGYINGTADETVRWRVEYRMRERDCKADQ